MTSTACLNLCQKRAVYIVRAKSSDWIAEVEKRSYSTHEGALELYIKAERYENGLLKVVEGEVVRSEAIDAYSLDSEAGLACLSSTKRVAIFKLYQTNQFLGTSSSKKWF